MAANSRKIKLERLLTKIRKTQVNLRTQVLLGNEDFEVYGKYVKTGGAEKIKVIEKNKYDPNNDLPRINCKGPEDDNKDIVIEETKKKHDAAKKHQDEDDAEGWSPVQNKRKNRSPDALASEKRTQLFSSAKAGKQIFKRICNRGILFKDKKTGSEDNTENESEDDCWHSH